MRKVIRCLLLALAITFVVPVSPINATGTLTQGEWTLVYPDFSKLVSEKEWIFEVRANGANEIGTNDFVDLDIYSSSNSLIASKLYIHSGIGVKSVKLSLYLDKLEISKANISQPLTAKLDIERSYNSKLKDGDFIFSIPTATFPKRPSTLGEYIKLNTDFSEPLNFPQDCTDIFFSYTMNDPYVEIDEVNFNVVDSAGKSLAGSYSYGYRSETIQGELNICPYTLDEAKGPLSFQIELQFESRLNKTPMIAQFPFLLKGKYVEVDALVTSMPNVCQKGNTYKTAKGACPSGFKNVSFPSLSAVQWNMLTRSASSLKNKKFLVYGCVAQFDTNTGGSKFRAYTLPSPSERYYNGANSLYTGAAKSLLKLSEDDAFAAKVTVLGATTYTTLGGKTSVPSFSVKDFIKIGTC